jgi:FtsZ-binding cell division protein ZapB
MEQHDRRNNNVNQAVELALIHRDIEDLKESTKELRAGQNSMRDEMKALATQEDIREIKEQLDQLMPWAQTLQTLEKLSKWIAAIAAAGGVLIAIAAWLRGG